MPDLYPLIDPRLDSSLALYLPLAGGTMTGDITLATSDYRQLVTEDSRMAIGATVADGYFNITTTAPMYKRVQFGGGALHIAGGYNLKGWSDATVARGSGFSTETFSIESLTGNAQFDGTLDVGGVVTLGNGGSLVNASDLNLSTPSLGTSTDDIQIFTGTATGVGLTSGDITISTGLASGGTAGSIYLKTNGSATVATFTGGNTTLAGTLGCGAITSTGALTLNTSGVISTDQSEITFDDDVVLSGTYNLDLLGGDLDVGGDAVVDGAMSIGEAIDSDAVLNIKKANFTSDAGKGVYIDIDNTTKAYGELTYSLDALNFKASVSHSSGTLDIARGCAGIVTQWGSSAVSSSYGLYGEVQYRGAGGADGYGVYGVVKGGYSGANDVGHFGGGKFWCDASEADVDWGYGIRIESPRITANGSIWKYYGVYIADADIGAGTNWAIYSAGGDSYFAGGMEIGGTLSAGATDVTSLTSTATRICKITKETGSTTLDATDEIVFVDTDGGSYTITLPAGVQGTHYRITNVGTSGNDVTVDGDGAVTVMGSATQTLADGETMNLYYYDVTEGWW